MRGWGVEIFPKWLFLTHDSFQNGYFIEKCSEWRSKMGTLLFQKSYRSFPKKVIVWYKGEVDHRGCTRSTFWSVHKKGKKHLKVVQKPDSGVCKRRGAIRLQLFPKELQYHPNSVRSGSKRVRLFSKWVRYCSNIVTERRVIIWFSIDCLVIKR